MHLELPRVSLHSLREFATHYLMIVVSILTALGLEAYIENAHHRHAAEAAREAIVAEIRANVAEVHLALEADRQRLKPLAALGDQLEAALSKGQPAAQVTAMISQRAREGIDIGLYFPLLHREAWDVAVANQSASWMDPVELRRLSAAYTSAVEGRMSDVAPLLDPPRFVDAITDARVGTVDPHEFLRVVQQATATLRAAVNRYEALERTLQRALGERGAAASH
jgi:hypothetical protein